MKVLVRNLLLSAALCGSCAVLLLSHANLQIRKSGNLSTASGTTHFELMLQNRTTEHGFDLHKSALIKHVGSRPNASWDWSLGLQVHTPDRGSI